MFHQTEAKFQGWRAVAELDDGALALLFVGRSSAQVRAGYAAAFAAIFEGAAGARVRGVAMQCWQGAADQGRWITKAALAVPASPTQARVRPGTRGASDGPAPTILAFRPAAARWPAAGGTAVGG